MFVYFRKRVYSLSLYPLSENYRGTSKVYQLCLVHQEFISTVHFSRILMVITKRRLKSCERIYPIEFSLFLKIRSLDTVGTHHQEIA